MHTLFWELLAFVGATFYCSFFEWTLHRFVMHKPWKFLKYPFRSHALTHHRVFRADHRYHLQDEHDRRLVPMAWWNPVVLWAIHVPPAILLRTTIDRPVFIGIFAAIILYYVAYEYLHWCMHIPAKREVEKASFFRRLNGHHLLHHRYPLRNLNVVLPVADVIFGTFLGRSPICFAQATGPAVPSVQPILRMPARKQVA